MACSTDNAIVRYRYWVILAWPDCPSWGLKRGITTVSNWMMMLAVMYGMMPSAKTLSCSNAPPLNRLMRPYSELPSTRVRQVWIAV